MSVVGPAYGTGSASDADAPAPTQAHRRRHTDVWRPATSEKVQVVVRVRPALPSEQDECVWTVNGNTIACKDPDVVGVDDAADRHHFQFDRVFDQSTSTQVLYETTMKAMLGSFLDGINGTIMTYGQTCSGKTFTLSGTEASPGVNSLVVRDLLAMVAQRTEPSTVSMSYFEIYNEEVYDLLAKKGQKGDSLRVRESFDTGVFIEGLNKKAVTSVEEVGVRKRKRP